MLLSLATQIEDEGIVRPSDFNVGYRMTITKVSTTVIVRIAELWQQMRSVVLVSHQKQFSAKSKVAKSRTSPVSIPNHNFNLEHQEERLLAANTLS